ncbi:MAG: MerR family transcriptional regulator [Desulfobacteraceae bacterium]|jgi:transcriptional regulator with XRE-family HTH domain
MTANHIQANISDLTWDQSIYPRSGKSQKTIDAYVEALNAGAQFPPISIQKVYNYPMDETATLIIDGLHRFFAYKECGEKKISAVYLDSNPLDYEKNFVTLLLESANANISHGDRLSANDKKRIARDIAGSDPECRWTEAALSEKLGITRQTVNNWISDIRTRQKAGRNTIIMRLSRLGWTHEQISELTGLTHGRIAQIVNNANFGEINNLLTQGHAMNYIARHYHMDLALAWALRLEGKTDREKFRELEWGLRTWNQWYFNECDERFGDNWPGRIPAQLVAHTLFYFTKPGDLVLDPMAGGGVVPDVCMLFERKCQAFDLAPAEDRPEIMYHYWAPENLKWPKTKKPDLIFFDPPYFSKKEKAYKEKADTETPPISSLGREQYEHFIEIFLRLAHENSKATTKLAFLNADWIDFESTPASRVKPENGITVFDYNQMLSETGWKIIYRIECPLSSERFNGIIVNRMQEKRILGTVSRFLLVAKRV